jgi:hypothetical protein
MQPIRKTVASLMLAGALSLLSIAIASAHHGWSWTQEGFFELTGVITAVYVGNPHATLDVEAEGETWRVELAPPSRTISAGFTEETVKVGDDVTAIGNRSLDENELRMKAVRVIVNGETYDVYPDRVPTN